MEDSDIEIKKANKENPPGTIIMSCSGKCDIIPMVNGQIKAIYIGKTAILLGDYSIFEEYEGKLVELTIKEIKG